MLHNKIIRTFSISIILFTLFLFYLPKNSWGLTGANVGIYNDTSYSGGGAWKDGLTAIKAMLDYYGYTHEDITPNDLNNSALDMSSLYKMVIFGGGWAGGYNTSVAETGFNNIRDFVSKGGGYFGICAGSYFASDIILWKENYSAPAIFYPYYLHLFNGLGIGAVLSIKEWTGLTGCSSGSAIQKGAAMTNINLNSSFFPNISSPLKILYYGGPVFYPAPFQSTVNSNLTVAATYKLPGDIFDGAPAMISFQYGNGKVFLSGPHPEVSFENCSLYYDYETWKLMKNVISILTGLQ